jgi:hypothetical protein
VCVHSVCSVAFWFTRRANSFRGFFGNLFRLQEWLLRLKYNDKKNLIRQLEWNPMEIVQLQQVNNKCMPVVDLWLDNIVVGFYH